MSKRTRPHKRSKVKKAAKRKTHGGFFSKYSSRAKIAAAIIVSILLAAASLAYWKVPSEKVAPASRSEAMNPARSKAMNKAPIKNVSSLSASELADIPPEAFTRQPPADVGYNAHSGGLPPGALPPGVVLPGMSMMQGGQGYGGYDGVRQQFTGKERDTETGLDYFGARYYSSTQGRFTSADPRNIIFEKDRGRNAEERARILQAYLFQPQNWNKYAYTRNNPLAYTDPNGRCSAPAGLSKGNAGVCIEAFIATSTLYHGLGRGDNRTFDANDANKTARVQVRGLLTPNSSGWNVQIETIPGVSETRGGIIKIPGEANTKITNQTIDQEGNLHLGLQITGVNGFSGMGGPSGDIKININLLVTPDGRVGIESGERTAYPTTGIYVYSQGRDGQAAAATLGEGKETTIDALNQPLVPIQPVPPTCNCKKPEDERRKNED